MMRKRIALLTSVAAASAVLTIVLNAQPQATTRPSTTQPSGSGAAGAAAATTSQPSGEKVTTPDGLTYIVTAPGDAGAKPGDIVWVHYVGTLKDGTKFDSSRDRGPDQPIRFTLGHGEVIKGWDEGIKGMKIGEKRTLIIPATLGYGERGSPPKIPANAELHFDVELIGDARLSGQ